MTGYARGRLGAVGLCVLCLALAACGFRWRGAPALPPALHRVRIEGLPAYDPLRLRLARRLQGAGVVLVGSTGTPAARLQVLARDRVRRPLTVSQRGQVTEYALVRSVRFRVVDALGQVVVPEQSVQVRRVYLYDRTDPLGKSTEEQAIEEAMAQDLVTLILRRLEAH
ncbi:MAG: hypothetical protein D6721_08625 [Gammaproteobacteria bacterium]|nr:MAG: hypothetical protein D6721_08625 [Gammaproteobacteria bacterium]